jgi:hypothetical protein
MNCTLSIIKTNPNIFPPSIFGALAGVYARQHVMIIPNYATALRAKFLFVDFRPGGGITYNFLVSDWLK